MEWARRRLAMAGPTDESALLTLSHNGTEEAWKTSRRSLSHCCRLSLSTSSSRATILLLWVCWKMYREIRGGALGESESKPHALGADVGPATHMSTGAAIFQILVADVSMSLDNVLAVAGAAKGHIWILIVGLILSIVLMAIAATFIARLLARYHWITWIGLAIILFVAELQAFVAAQGGLASFADIVARWF
jgi:YjbE family integral membrane protein